MTEVTYVGQARYLDQVEGIIGMPFFSDPALEENARTNLSLLPVEDISSRAGLYVAGLRLVLGGRASRDSSPENGLSAVRAQNREAIREIRGQLMTLDQNLETSVVVALRQALGQVRVTRSSSRTPNRSLQPAQELPPELLPVKAAAKIITMQRANIQNRVWPQGTAPRKVRLPGNRAEACCTWTELQTLVEGTDISGQPRQLRPGVEIEWDKLPKEGIAASEDQVAYARELQQRFMSTTPNNAGELPVARRYHLSLFALHNLLGGGYSFVEEFCTAHSIPLLRRARWESESGTARSADYLFVEDAADIWDAYKMIPVADKDDVIAADILKRSGTARTAGVSESLMPDELRYVEKKRALRPKGRVLSHFPDWLARRLVGRLRPITLPAHLLPMQSIGEIIKPMDTGYIRRLRRELKFRTTTLNLKGSPRNLPQVCFDWPTVQRIVGPKDLLLEVNFEMLPQGPNEIDEARIAYARSIQRQLVPSDIQASFSDAVEVQVIPDMTATLPIVPKRLMQIPAIVEPVVERSQEMWRTKSTSIGQGGSYFSGNYQFRGAGSKDGLPTEKPRVQVRHLAEIPGSWVPAIASGPRVLSRTERLTADGIASALAVSRDAVNLAISRIDFVTTEADEVDDRVYTGNNLVAIREQLVGVPLEYLQMIHELSDDELIRVKEFLLRNKFESFDEFVSPGAVDYLTVHIHTARELRDEPKKQENKDIIVSADGETL